MDSKTLQLLEGFAHELRTPLSAIAGHASLLSLGVHGPLTEAQAHALDRIEENKKQLISLIGDLANYAEAAATALAQPRDERAISPVVTQGIAALAESALSHDVRFDWLEDGHESESQADEEMQDIGLFNECITLEVIKIMLEDALVHSERKSVVKVRVGRIDKVVRVAVGTSAAARADFDAELLFVPYARDSHGRPVHGPGRSLCLPRARALARSMEADLHAVLTETRRVLQFDVPHRANVGASDNV